MIALVLAALAVAAPQPGQHATIDVSVATLWKAPGLARPIDAPALRNPVDLDAWNRNLSTTAARSGLGGRVVTQALYGERVKVLAVRGRWAKVVVPDQPTPLDRRGYPGWVPLRQLVTGYDGSGPGLTVVTRKALLHLAHRILPLGYGTRLPRVGRTASGAWRVRTPDGPGWVARSALAPSPAATGSHVVAAAGRFLGLRYLWGGVSSWGFDCSGLVWDVFRALGVTVPRDADPQFRGGRRVSPAALRPGDLVFYGTPSHVSHVAIYVGGGRMIEAPDSAHAVRIVPLRRGPSLVGARRYTTG
ncbi:MAG TPA: C40 family peptidase [Gaiellaceae bacterium]|nr:C40 family peptidase [Gaiellaceae bacterium]